MLYFLISSLDLGLGATMVQPKVGRQPAYATGLRISCIKRALDFWSHEVYAADYEIPGFCLVISALMNP